MTVLTFPSNPIEGQQYAAPNGIQYVFDGVKWIVETTTSSSEAVTNSTQDRVAPMFVDGDNTGITFTYNAATNTMSAVVTAVNGNRLVNGTEETVLGSNGDLTTPGNIILTGGIVGPADIGVGVGIYGNDPTTNTPGGTVYLQGGASLLESGGPTSAGGNVIISAGQGSNDVNASSGGDVEIYGGAASQTAGSIRIEGGGTYGSNGQGGNIEIYSGSSVSGVAGNITIQSGAGSGGGTLFEGSLDLRGSTVNLTSSSESFKIKTGDVDFNDPAGPFVWEFKNNGQLLVADDIRLPPSGRFVKDCGSSGSTTAMRWVNIPTIDSEQLIQLFRIYTGDPAIPGPGDIERAALSVEWQDDQKSGISIAAFDRTEGASQVQYRWKFKGDGVLQLPENGDIVDSNGQSVLSPGLGDFSISGSELSADQMTIKTVDGDITIESDSNVFVDVSGGTKRWSFANDGNLTLPEGGDILNSTGSSVLGGNANTGDFVFSNNFLTVSAGDQVVIEGETDGDARIDIPNNDWAENSKALTISNSGAQGVKISTGANAVNTWEFDYRGALRLPVGGDIINNSGQSVLGGGSYTPEDPDNWNDPTVNTVQAALDELAAKVAALQNFEIDGGNAFTPAAGELIIDGNGA